MSIITITALTMILAQDATDSAAKVKLDESHRIGVLRKIRPNVVAVFGPGGQGGGSGVLVSADGFALTNFHVTQPCGIAMKCGINDGKLYDAVLVGLDPVGDVALIKLIGRTDFPFAPLGDSDRLALGDEVLALGNPFLLATDFEPTISFGIVSGLHRYQYPAGTLLEYADCIQTDASVNPGNSGGPLFNIAGELVGINGRISLEKRGRVNVGVGYAISINQIKNFLDHLRGGMLVDHATLGATVTTDDDGKVVVQEILTNTDAYRRGLRAGDELVSFAGRPIGSTNQFKNVLGVFPKGYKVELTYRRADQKATIQTRLLGVHRAGELLKDKSAPPADPNQPKKQKGKQPEKKQAPPMFGKPPIPKEAKPFIEEKEGFANYYFNRMQKERMLGKLKQAGAIPAPAGTWNIRFVAQDKKEIALSIGPEKIILKAGADVFSLNAGDSENLTPLGSGGLLVAVDNWKRLLVDQEKWFSRFEFAGGIPDASGEVQLALVAERAGVETNFLFDRASGELSGLECQIERNGDPCEISFSDYRTVAGKSFPHRWVIRCGNTIYGTWTMKSMEIKP